MLKIEDIGTIKLKCQFSSWVGVTRFFEPRKKINTPPFHLTEFFVCGRRRHLLARRVVGSGPHECRGRGGGRGGGERRAAGGAGAAARGLLCWCVFSFEIFAMVRKTAIVV